LLCTRLAQSFDKIGCGPAKQNESFLTFILLCTHLALSFDKIGRGSAKQNESFLTFILLCTHLALSLYSSFAKKSNQQ